MKKYGKIVTQNKSGKPSYRWAVQTFFLSISMSLIFGLLSQTLLSSMGALFAIVGISVFIGISVLFDMLGIAVASADEDTFLEWNDEKVDGARAGLKLCRNSEKVCSFCADVIGDICSTLCGAGGACVVVALTQNLNNPTILILISVSVSALIAGMTIFFKALMKQRALSRSNQIILKLGKILERTIYREPKK